jgi:hypothetical protein
MIFSVIISESGGNVASELAQFPKSPFWTTLPVSLFKPYMLFKALDKIVHKAV